MIQRPKPGETEDDILRIQEEFLRAKNTNQNLLPAAQVVNLRGTHERKRTSTNDRKPSKYAQSKGLKNHEDKRSKTEASTSLVGDIQEKNVEHSNELAAAEDDKVYFPKVLPSLLGNIVEKSCDEFVDFSLGKMPPQGFPAVARRDKIINRQKQSEDTNTTMEVDEAPSNIHSSSGSLTPVNFPNRSYIVSSKDANGIHNENVNLLSKMTEKEILEEQEKLLTSLDPNIIQFLKSRRKPDIGPKSLSETKPENADLSDSQTLAVDSLWENDVLSHPQVNKWLHFNSLEKDKLEWMRGIEESKKIKDGEPYEARFNFEGYLLPYAMEYMEQTKTLFHHGEEPHRPGYTLAELFELSRSTITQQRVMALNTLAGVIEYYSSGIYKDILELPLSKIFFIIRIAIDENKTIILEPALKAMRNLVFNRIDEACLDALLGYEEGCRQPCLENDKSEIEELDSKESELKDFHLAEIDLVAALLRTDVLQRIYYILETVRPGFNCVQYSLQILTRLVRDSVETSVKISEMDHLMSTVMQHFVPATSINFMFNPQIVYNGKPLLAALKFLRVLSLQSEEIGTCLITKYNILKSVSQYISSGVDGTYALRIQIEAYCIMTNLLQYNSALETASSLFPVIVTSLHKHVQGTNFSMDTSVISATHAAVVLQFINKLLTCKGLNLENYKFQIYPLLKEAVLKWLAQLSQSENYTCGHLKLIASVLDCCKSMIIIEKIPIKFLNDSLKVLAKSKGFNVIARNVVSSSNLLSGLENKDLHLIKNLKTLGGSVVDKTQKVLPILNMTSPLPFLASLFNMLIVVEERDVIDPFVAEVLEYFKCFSNKTPSLCDNWFTRIETDFLLYSIALLCNKSNTQESQKDVIYEVANKLCFILRIDKRIELDFLFRNIIFNKQWFTAERLLNLVSVSDADGFSRVLFSVEDIKVCYDKVVNLTYKDTGPNIVFRKWQEPILPRDWIYLPILSLYSKSQETDTSPRIVGKHADKLAAQESAEKELIVNCSLEWILFNELCFPDLIKDISITDRFCRIMCVFLCDNSLFLDSKIKILLRKITQVLYKKNSAFDFDTELVGLHNFQDFYTQFLEQFQSVSYGDETFASCVLVPLAQKHNVKWRKLLWSEYAGCLRALDCAEESLCYELNDYLYPTETDESVVKSYCRALSSNLLRPGTISYRIAQHHTQEFKKSITNR